MKAFRSLLHLALLSIPVLGFSLISHAALTSTEKSYIGSQACQTCHQKEYQQWQGSHHDMSMRHAKPDAVQGNFDNAEVVFNGEVSRFYRKGEQYWINIKGPEGAYRDYQIKYTFGYTPLQQYMVEFDDGRIQLIPFAWDSRSATQGGQRWFHLYPEFTDKRDEFFWTNTGQNWNYMCADCHSTNVSKNFDLKTDSYNTTFNEINVGCEACHGPGQEHVAWVNSTDKTLQKNRAAKHKGFDRQLGKSVSQWLAAEGKKTLQPENITPSQQTLVCAQCHSRHVQISDKDYIQSNAFGDRYRLSLINRELYHADGQIFDEVFVYGSFLQSKMHQQGVTCSNCHNPHSSELVMPKETLCLQCHQHDAYAVKSHHGHSEESPGAQCVSCHMPETTFMQVDARRDHGWHIPRPDLARQLGTPDTCLSCHTDKDSQWSDSKVSQWHPQSVIRQQKHFAPVFSAIDAGYYRQASSALSHIAQNKENAPIIRASAIERMGNMADTNSMIAVARGAKDPDEFIRLAAAQGGSGLALAERWRILSPLLSDKVLAIRMEAANSLVSLWSQLSTAQRSQLQPALEEYLQAQAFNSDRGFSHSNRGTVYAYQGEFELAEQAFKTAIDIEPNAAQAYLNLAEVYRQSSEGESKVINILRQGANAVKRNGIFYYRLGLAHIRAGDTQKAVEHFTKAVDREADNAQYHYVLGLTLEKVDVAQAQAVLRRAYTVGGDPRHLYALCEMQVRHRTFAANQCIAELSKVAPPKVIQQLRAQMSGGQ